MFGGVSKAIELEPFLIYDIGISQFVFVSPVRSKYSSIP